MKKNKQIAIAISELYAQACSNYTIAFVETKALLEALDIPEEEAIDILQKASKKIEASTLEKISKVKEYDLEEKTKERLSELKERIEHMEIIDQLKQSLIGKGVGIAVVSVEELFKKIDDDDEEEDEDADK